MHNDDLDVVNGYWLCASQTRGAGAYSVNGSCDCADYRNAGAVVHGRIFCKHKLALEAYRRILEQHLAQRLIGNARFRTDLDRSRAAPHTCNCGHQPAWLHGQRSRPNRSAHSTGPSGAERSTTRSWPASPPGSPLPVPCPNPGSPTSTPTTITPGAITGSRRRNFYSRSQKGHDP